MARVESMIAERIEDFENNLPSYIKLAYLPSFGRVRLRLSAKGTDKAILERALEKELQQLYKLLSDIITGQENGVTIEEHIGNLLKDSGKTLSTAESLTGGKIAATIVSVAGSSAYYKGSFITYTAEMKQQLLDVSKETIKNHSVVSAEVVKEMAVSAKNKTNSDYAIAVTGNAGPTTDKTDKMVGVVLLQSLQVKVFI